MNRLIFVFIALNLFMSCKGADGSTVQSSLPELKQGKLVYHTYSCYDCMDSKIMLYEFASGSIKTLSTDWKIQNPMNAHFSPDGKQITFMGIAPNGSWDIFLYTLDTSQEPVNLTNSAAVRDEDPKFSFDGKSIIFKQNGQLALFQIANGQVLKLTDFGETTLSMPYFNPAGNKVVCSVGNDGSSAIYLYDISSKSFKKLYDRNGIAEYYPVTLNEQCFYFSAHLSELNQVDQLYLGYWDGRQSEYLPFNRADADYSDACPVNEEWLILSSTRKGTRGGYDLYIANRVTGDIHSLTEYNNQINSEKWELGASYTPY